ncbi:MAG: recombination protein NinB [Moraxellaceae bacterium]|nr:recombination protein NinB [Moraxellaceae bacterium]
MQQLTTKTQIENQRFNLLNDDIRDNCVKAIWTAHEQADKPISVIITPQQETRSKAQNRLYWKWLEYFGSKTGYTKEELHLIFKKKFLAHIYARDNVSYRNMAIAIKRLKELGMKEYKPIAEQVYEETSTRKATTKQMSEYLQAIDRFCYGKGVTLITPPDLQWVKPKFNK